jgi:predicted CXXCH cytochrome family protein
MVLEDSLAIPGIKKCVVALACLAGLALCGGPQSSAGEPQRAGEAQQRRSGREGFPHEQKAHRKVECSKCHKTSTDTDEPKAKDFPHGDCISCHNFAAEVFKAALSGSNRFCGICHSGRPVSKSQPALFGRFPQLAKSDFGLDFSHEAHRKPLPADLRIAPVNEKTPAEFESRFTLGDNPKCTSCHLEVRPVGAEARDMRTVTGHPVCFTCHGTMAAGGRRRPAEEFPYSNDCGACHELGGPQSRDLLPKVVRFRHADHDVDIRPKRKADFPLPKAPDRLCAECHQSAAMAKSLDQIKLPEESRCNQCHNGRLGLPDALAQDVLNSLRRR